MVPYSYDEFASTVNVLGFATGTSMLKYFAESPQNSPEKRLYTKLLQRNVTIGNGRPLDIPDWAKRSFGTLFYNKMYGLSKHYVSIGSQMYLTDLLTRTCWAKVYSEDQELQKFNPYLHSHFVPYFKNLYPWVTSDPGTQAILHGFIKRKDFTPDKKIWKRVKRSIEYGMFQRIMLTAEATGSSERLPIEIKKRPTQMRDCKQYSRKLKIKEAEFQALKVINFKVFTLVFLALISVCCMTYVVEVALKERPTQVHPM